jgi:cytochrome c peroxidase
MSFKPFAAALMIGLCVGLLQLACGGSRQSLDTPTLAAVGRSIFFDDTLSEPAGQSCASCHDPKQGFTDPRGTATSEGVIPGSFGSRNAPPAAYAVFSPAFYYDAAGGSYRGGQFLDGRASTLSDQAQGPPLNPIEMHNPDVAAYSAKVASRAYAAQLRSLLGEDLFADPVRAMRGIAKAVEAFERTKEVSPFSSKYDAYLDGKAGLSPQERLGLALFEGKAGCAACHPNRPGPDAQRPLFTDFTYDNIGIPRNPANPFYAQPATVNPMGATFVDIGLAGNPRVIKDGAAQANRGRFKVSTLRNVALTAPYTHNGIFTTLKDVVAFYNKRDVDPVRFGPPEVPETVNRVELGHLGLSDEEEDALVAFLNTLTDGYPAP